MASGKVKYAKLRLFKPSTSGSSKPEVLQDNGESSKEPPASQPEVIDLVDSEPEPDENLLKRTRLDSREKSPDSPILRLPKLPRKPPEGGSGIIRKFFKASEDDFEPPKKESAPKAKTKVQRKATTRKPRASRKASQDIRKAFHKYQDNDELLLNDLMAEHSRAENVDPEQLQLAIAMSRSMSEHHGPGGDLPDSQQPEVGSSASESTLQERRIQGIRTTLEQYGFKCKGNYADQDLNAIFGTAPQAAKNSRRGKARRKTMLIRRAPEDIVAFMERGADRLLKDELHAILKDAGDFRLDARSYGSDVFWMSENPNLGEAAISEYYVESLVEPVPANAGYLLKDWHAIPGRERTPERKPATNTLKPPTPETPKKSDPNQSELLQDPEDAKLDMSTVSEDYREKYNNEVPLPVVPAEVVHSVASSPELFGSEDGEEEDDGLFMTAPEVMEVKNEEDSVKETLPAAEVLCTSSDDMFEDFDPADVSEPIIDCDMYSSEEDVHFFQTSNHDRP